MADFITNGASELPGVKSDERPAHVPVGVSEWAASDTNKLRQALLDTRSALVTEIVSRVNSDLAIIESGQTPTNVQEAPVIATGSTTARQLDDRFADVVNVKDFGAVGDGNADDTAAIQAALDTAKATSGASVSFPVGTYIFSSPLALSAATGIKLAGTSASNQTVGGSALVYTGTDSPALSFSACASPAIDNLSIRYTNASFAGTLVSFPMCSNVSITRSGLLGSGVSGALYLLSLDTTTEIGISDTNFDFAQYAILGQDPTGSGYCNVVSIRTARFGNGITVGDIRNPGQGWSIVGSSFENIANGKGQAIKMSDSQPASGLHISGCWLGDATEQATAWAWIEFVGEGLSIEGCYIHGTGIPTSTGVKLVGNATGVSITGNHIGALAIGVDIGAALGTYVVIAGNSYPGTTVRVSGVPANKAWIMDGSGGLAFDLWDAAVRAMTVTMTRAAFSGAVSPGTDTGAAQNGSMYQGANIPSDSNGIDGDIYFRTINGGAGTTIYHKRAGAWVGIV